MQGEAEATCAKSSDGFVGSATGSRGRASQSQRAQTDCGVAALYAPGNSVPTDEFLCVQVWLELQTATSRNCSANMWVRAWTQRRCAGPKSFAGCVHFISLCIILTCVDMCWLVGATSPFYFVASKVSVPLASLRARWLLPAHYVLVDRGRREVVVAVRGEGVELSGGEFGWMLSAALGYWCSKGI